MGSGGHDLDVRDPGQNATGGAADDFSPGQPPDNVFPGMKTETDSAGQLYIQVSNVRVTFVPKERRTSSEKDWANSDMVRIQSFQDGKGGRLNQGAEFPVDEALRVMAAICQLSVK